MNKPIKVGSDCAGVGAFPQSLKRLNINFTEEFACDFDYFARLTYCKNYGTEADFKLAQSKEHKKYAEAVKKTALSDKPPSVEDGKILNEANEFAKNFSFYFPFNIYQREIPEQPLDIYVGSFPCQSFSLAGKRKGQEDKRGILFYCGHEFIDQNRPRYFIIENVKGLLSDDGGKTFQRWIDYLGGKSVNGSQAMFPEESAVPYHVYYQVLNAKYYGVPQNRERIFIIGIRDDADNNFNFPKPFELKKRLKDVLEENVDNKYYLSDKMVDGFIGLNPNGVARTIRCGGGSSKDDKNNWDLLKVGYINQDTQASQVIHEDSVSQTLCAGTHGYANGYVQLNSATSKGYEIAKVGEDSINFEHPNSKTRRGRVGVGVGQTLTTSCNQGVAIGAIRGRNIDNPKSRESGLPTQQMLEVNENGTSNCLTTVQKDNVVIEEYGVINPLKNKTPYGWHFEQQIYDENGITRTVKAGGGSGNNPKLLKDYRIRKLTPRECFRLMDFPDTFDFSVVSDSQAYKQAGNSIVVNVLAQIISKFNL